jgi:hypothetical protein
MKRIILASVMMAMLGGPAHSQMSMGGSKEKTPLQLKYEREEQDRKQNEKAYEDQMKRLKSQAPVAGKRDPWAGVRPAPETNSKR